MASNTPRCSLEKCHCPYTTDERCPSKTRQGCRIECLDGVQFPPSWSRPWHYSAISGTDLFYWGLLIPIDDAGWLLSRWWSSVGAAEGDNRGPASSLRRDPHFWPSPGRSHRSGWVGPPGLIFLAGTEQKRGGHHATSVHPSQTTSPGHLVPGHSPGTSSPPPLLGEHSCHPGSTQLELPK